MTLTSIGLIQGVCLIQVRFTENKGPRKNWLTEAGVCLIQGVCVIRSANKGVAVGNKTSFNMSKLKIYTYILEGGYQITVDNKRVKTPAGNRLIVPSKPLAIAVSVEWNSQVETIKPANMHLVIKQLSNALCICVLSRMMKNNKN